MWVNEQRIRNAVVLFLTVLLTVAFVFFKASSVRVAIAESLSRTTIHSTEPFCMSLLNQARSLPIDSTDTDAELLAMEISGELLPPPALYNQIHGDLTTIRQSYPEMNFISHRARWVPGQLLVGLTPEAWEQFQNGNYHGLDDLNAQYGPVEITVLAPSIAAVHLQFEQRYNPEYLAPLYAGADGVRYAEPNTLMGDGPDIQASIPQYTFKWGWGDCTVGCIYNHYWVFTVIDGIVTLVSEYGDPIPQALIVSKHAHPDPLQGGETLTYTIHITTTTNMPGRLHATATDTLPVHILPGTTSGGALILPGGTLTWTPTLITPGGVWTEQFTVTVQTGYVGPLTNVVQVTTDEGPTDDCTITTQVAKSIIHLPMVLRNYRTWDAYYEENDHWLDAYGPLVPGQTYLAYPEDTDDYYYFELSAQATVNISVENYAPTSNNGQLLLYGPVTGDEQGDRIGHFGEPGHSSMSIGPMPLDVGKYYIRVYTTKNHSTDQLYRLTVTY